MRVIFVVTSLVQPRLDFHMPSNRHLAIVASRINDVIDEETPCCPSRSPCQEPIDPKHELAALSVSLTRIQTPHLDEVFSTLA